jgi:putative toxin-antitoxin system antitoxin component (TIGR02293 family)
LVTARNSLYFLAVRQKGQTLPPAVIWHYTSCQMTTTAGIVKALGGKSILKANVSSAAQLAETIRTGLPYAALEALISKLHLPRSGAAAALNLPERTLARRRKEKKLSPDESDRVLRLAMVFSHASNILDGDDNAAAWFSEPNRSLGGNTPLSLIDTATGAREVEDVLSRMAHGIFS